jgi:hypothetical protein
MKLGFNGKPIPRKRQDVMSVLKEQAMRASKVPQTAPDSQSPSHLHPHPFEPTMALLQQHVQHELHTSDVYSHALEKEKS